MDDNAGCDSNSVGWQTALLQLPDGFGVGTVAIHIDDTRGYGMPTSQGFPVETPGGNGITSRVEPYPTMLPSESTALNRYIHSLLALM